MDPVRGTVGSTFDFTIVSFPPNAQVDLLFIGNSGVNVDLGPATTDATGRATGTRTVPTVLGGPKEVRAFSGNEVETTPFEVAPRVRVTPESVQRGQSVAVAVTGFGPAEFVRIRWLVNGSYVQVGTLTTGINGSGTVNVTVPANAPAGATAVRADGTTFAAQTNAVTVVIPQPPAVDHRADPGHGQHHRRLHGRQLPRERRGDDRLAPDQRQHHRHRHLPDRRHRRGVGLLPGPGHPGRARAR